MRQSSRRPNLCTTRRLLRCRTRPASPCTIPQATLRMNRPNRSRSQPRILQVTRHLKCQAIPVKTGQPTVGPPQTTDPRTTTGQRPFKAHASVGSSPYRSPSLLFWNPRLRILGIGAASENYGACGPLIRVVAYHAGLPTYWGRQKPRLACTGSACCESTGLAPARFWYAESAHILG